MNKKHKKVCTTLNYIEGLLILAFTVTACISISAFASLVGIIGITSSPIGFNNCATTAGIIMYRSIIQKKNMKSDKIALLPKTKLKTLWVLVYINLHFLPILM